MRRDREDVSAYLVGYFAFVNNLRSPTFFNMIKTGLAMVLLAMHTLNGQTIDISGTVKNPSGVPLSGARVLFQNANLSDTTGSDGDFHLQSAGTPIHPGSGLQPTEGISAEFQSGVLAMVAAEGSQISLQVYSQLGRELFSGDYLVATGVKTHGIQGIGNERVVVRIRSGAYSLAAQGLPRLGSIQTRITGVKPSTLKKGAVVVPDSLVITKEGFLRHAVKLTSSDTSGLEIRMTGSTGKTPISGTFRVSLFPPTSLTTGYAALMGALYTGPIPVPVIWEEVGSSGACKLLKPRAPLCENPCGTSGVCVADNTCQDFPASIEAGNLAVKGVKTVEGTSQFIVSHLLGRYVGPALAYPPFTEGDDVSFSVPGDSGISPISISAKGIRPLEVLADSLFQVDGQPMALEWVSPSASNASRVFVELDLSHHGGIKGKVECEGPDNGSMEIAAPLVGQLKALGVAGYPRAIITRRFIESHEETGVKLVLESSIRLSVSVPGLISCSNDGDCPTDQFCGPDLQCK